MAISRTKPSAPNTRAGQMRPNPRSAGSGASHHATGVDHYNQNPDPLLTPGLARRSILASRSISKKRALPLNSPAPVGSEGSAAPLAPAAMIDVGVHSANITKPSRVAPIFLLNLGLPRHVRPIRDHGHGAVRSDADENVCLIVSLSAHRLRLSSF